MVFLIYAKHCQIVFSSILPSIGSRYHNSFLSGDANVQLWRNIVMLKIQYVFQYFLFGTHLVLMSVLIIHYWRWLLYAYGLVLFSTFVKDFDTVLSVSAGFDIWNFALLVKRSGWSALILNVASVECDVGLSLFYILNYHCQFVLIVF